MILTLLTSLSVFAMDKIVYGSDDRRDLYQVKDQKIIELARSTAAMIDDYMLKANADGSFTLEARTLATRGICEGEKFSDQMAAAKCSGFLVGEDLLVTAGHCIQYQSHCNSAKWVFDYALRNAKATGSMQIPADNVYKCTEIISQTLDSSTKNDYALVRLDRPVVGRTPLKYRKSGKIKRRTKIFVIGHPSGLPTKVADNAKVRKMNNIYFTTNLDTFGGNSGSAVFNAKTYEVEGILVRGDQDYVEHRRQNCVVVNRCRTNGCRGEDVTNITNIKEL
jgi:V8-like Glu-specific endopeptidase